MGILEWMAHAAVVGSLIAAAAWCLDRTLGRAGIPTRWVWAGAIALSLALPAAALLPSSDGVRVDGSASLVEGSAGVSERESGGIGPESPTALPTSLRVALPLPFMPGRFAERLEAALATAISPLPSGPRVDRWIVSLWTGTSAMLLVLLAVATLRLARRRVRWPSAVLCGRTIRISPDLGPAALGIVRPEIVVPMWATALDRDELELILAHEEQHVRSRDPLLLAGGAIATLLFPWNPALWWQLRQMRAAIELDCDRRVLQTGVPAVSYAELLFRIGADRGSGRVAVAALAASTSLLERRLSAMKERSLRVTIPLSLLGSALAAGLLVVACQVDAPNVPPSVSAPMESPAEPDVGEREAAEAVAGASTGTVTGRVIDAATGTPLPGIRVEVQGVNRSGLTDDEGQFTIEGTPSGVFRVSARHEEHGFGHRDNVPVPVADAVSIEISMGVPPRDR